MNENKYLTKIETCPSQNVFFKTERTEMNDITPDREWGVVNVFDDVKYQEVLGFGGAFTESSAYLYSLLSKENKKRFLELYFSRENGTVMADCFGPNVYHNGCPNDRYTVQYTYFDEWVGLIDEFVDNIRNSKTPLINLKWHKKTIEAMNAVYESIATGKVVML